MATAGPAHRVESAQVEYGYPQGHLGHLTPEETTSFEQFKKHCEEHNVYKPGDGAAVTPSHDDATLLRFLRARRFEVTGAFAQFEATEAWRAANQIPQIYESIDLDQFEETRRLYPQWTGRRDKRGIPVYVFEVKHLNSKTMSAYEKSAAKTHTTAKTDGKTPAKMLRLFALYENLIRFVMPLCSAVGSREYPETPITQSNNIVDISGVGLKQFWNLRSHMQDASTLATAHYPETLDRIFIIGAPSFFPTVWGWIKRWFDPITTSKIFIIAHNDVKSTLESFIDPANIPTKYGGKLAFEFGDMPNLDPALEGVLTWENGFTDFPQGPISWTDVDDGKGMEAIAVGSLSGKERRVKLCQIKKPFKPTASESTKKPELAEEPPATEAAKTKGGPIVGSETAAPASNTNVEAVSETATGTEKPITETATGIEGSSTLAPSRPEPVSFVTASEDLSKLSINEKTNETAPPTSATVS